MLPAHPLAPHVPPLALPRHPRALHCFTRQPTPVQAVRPRSILIQTIDAVCAPPARRATLRHDTGEPWNVHFADFRGQPRRRRSNQQLADHLRQLHRHSDRVLRFLRLCDSRRARYRPGVLSAWLGDRAGAVGVRHVRHRVRRAADRLVSVRSLRRPHRPQIDPRRLVAGDGRLDHADRFRTRLRLDRQPRVDPAVRPALWPGDRPGRRMGRRRAARHRKRPRRQAWLVRHVPAAWTVDRFSGVQRPVLRPRTVALGRAVPQLGLARAVHRQRCWLRSACTCA